MVEGRSGGLHTPTVIQFESEHVYITGVEQRPVEGYLKVSTDIYI